jgi:Domain of unknown function DUF29
MATTKQVESALYDRDFYSWAREQAHALIEHRIEELDWENLAEEVADLARSERRAFRSQCARLTEHLLKFAFSPSAKIERDGRLWRLSLIEERSELTDLLAESPGLRPSIGELFEAGWRIGRLQALKAIEVPDEAIPKAPLWSFDQAIDENFIPSK